MFASLAVGPRPGLEAFEERTLDLGGAPARMHRAQRKLEPEELVAAGLGTVGRPEQARDDPELAEEMPRRLLVEPRRVAGPQAEGSRDGRGGVGRSNVREQVPDAPVRERG